MFACFRWRGAGKDARMKIDERPQPWKLQEISANGRQRFPTRSESQLQVSAAAAAAAATDCLVNRWHKYVAVAYQALSSSSVQRST